MNDDIRTAALVPLVEPYTGIAYPHVSGGGEGTTAPVLAITGNDAIVDWVVLELRDATDPSVVLITRSALLQRDGDVVDLDGVSPVRFGHPAGSYHVAVRHRNHLGVMTASPVALSGTPLLMDFTTDATVVWGLDARMSMTGTFPAQVLWSGDVSFDGEVKYTGSANDRDLILQRIGGSVPTNTVPGYYGEDVNMDGEVKYTGLGNDRDPILVNIGGVVPTSVRAEQLT